VLDEWLDTAETEEEEDCEAVRISLSDSRPRSIAIGGETVAGRVSVPRDAILREPPPSLSSSLSVSESDWECAMHSKSPSSSSSSEDCDKSSIDMLTACRCFRVSFDLTALVVRRLFQAPPESGVDWWPIVDSFVAVVDFGVESDTVAFVVVVVVVVAV